MRRREFITLIGGTAATWPITGRAQQSRHRWSRSSTAGAADALMRYAAAFRKGLSEMGYDEEKNVTVEYHWLEGKYALLPDLLDNLIRRRVAVIATPGSTPAALAAKAANHNHRLYSVWVTIRSHSALLRTSRSRVAT